MGSSPIYIETYPVMTGRRCIKRAAPRTRVQDCRLSTRWSRAHPTLFRKKE